ncbi:MAG: hypothetical protein PHR16_03230 [Methylovulum sp.]|nr:hypothetical protein [Methylovulum sp.]
MNEILFYLKGILKYKWIAVSVVWILCLSGWGAVLVLPNKYTSEARVHVETKTMLQPLLRGMTVQSDIRGLLLVMQSLMFTKDNLERIIKLAELDKDINNSFDLLQKIGELKKKIHIIGGANDIFTIQYEAGNPDEAKNVVQAVLTVFSEKTQLSTLFGADEAHHFIDEQIHEYEMRLRNSERALENFKRANLGLLPGQSGNQISDIQQISSTLEDAKLQLSEATSRKVALQTQLDEAMSGDDWGVVDEKIDVEDARITELKQKKDNLLIKYTAKHPEIVYIDKMLKKLEKELVEKKAKLSPVEDVWVDSAVMANPYIQTIKVAMNDTDANIASINSRVEKYEARLKTARDELNMRLSIETEMQNLNRDYETIKKNYEQLLVSREQASMSKKVDDQSDALKFKIADAPNVPLEPSSPKRKLLYSIVLGAGSVCGLAVSFLIYLIRPTFLTVKQIRQIAGLPVLGVISFKISSKEVEKNKKETLRFNAAILGLFLVYIGFMSIDILSIKLSLINL